MADEFDEDEIRELKEVFSLFDTKNQECIATKDLGTVLKAFGKDLEKDELAELKNDADDHGSIHFSEFLCVMVKVLRNVDQLKEARDVFKLMDKDGGTREETLVRHRLTGCWLGGAISPAELRHLMVNSGECLNDEEVDTMIAAADTDGENAAHRHSLH